MKNEESSVNNGDILSLIQRAINDFNDQRTADERLLDTPEASLFGRDGKLDSLGLVNLILAVEERISSELDVNITLADERAMSWKGSPFKTVQSLVDYVAERLKEEKSD
jgi:acyl carrier protein